MKLWNSIRIGDQHGRGYAEITDCTLSIERTFVGVRFRFNFTIKPFNISTSPAPFLERLDVDLSYRDTKKPHLLGRMIDELRTTSQALSGNGFSLAKDFDLGTDDFMRLVNRSHRSDMIFELKVLPVLRNSDGQANQESGSLTIPHSEWLEIIGRAEIERFELIVIRIPVASSHLHAPFSEALSKIREAEQNYIRGDWNGVALSCRAAWRTILSGTPSGAGAIEHLLTPLSEDPSRQAFARPLAKGLHDILNNAVHLEGDLKSGRTAGNLTAADALLCIHWYSAIIGYLSSLHYPDSLGTSTDTTLR